MKTYFTIKQLKFVFKKFNTVFFNLNNKIYVIYIAFPTNLYFNFFIKRK